jgi:plastocyanin
MRRRTPEVPTTPETEGAMKALAGAIVVLLMTGVARAATFDCDDLDAIKAGVSGCENASQLVCINDFQYTPPVITAAVGDTVAWVNVEACGDSPPEDAVVNTLAVGCDPTHQVVTLPLLEPATGDSINETGICSPNPGVAGDQVPVAPPPCDELETNVRCHTFASPGVQHYSCLTNPAHGVLMHGGIVIQP